MVKKGNTKDLCDNEMAHIFTDSISISWLWYYTIILQSVTTGGTWVKGTQDLFVLFLTTACESKLSQNKKFNLKEKS